MKTKVAVLSFLLGFMFSSAVNAEQITPPENMSDETLSVFNEAVRQYNGGEYEKAVSNYSKVCAEFPDYEPAQEYLGLSLFDLGRFNESIVALTKAHKLHPQNAQIVLNLGHANFNLGRLQESLEQYENYLKLEPTGDTATSVKDKINTLKTEIQRTASVASSVGSDNYLAETTQNGASRWKASKMPIPVFIAEPVNLRAYDREFGEALKQSFSDWAAASEGRVSFKFVPDETQADVICSWTDDKHKFVDSNEAGLCKSSVATDGQIVRAVIQLLIPENVKVGESAVENARQVCLHEIGHALGVGGHSSQISDVMFMTKPTTSRLSFRDKETLRQLYQAPDSFIAAHPMSGKLTGLEGHDDNPQNRASKATARGAESIAAGNYSAAIAAFEEAHKAVPQEPSLTYNLANAYYRLALKEQKEHDTAAFDQHINRALDLMIEARHKEKAAELCAWLASLARSDKREADAVKYESRKHELEMAK